MSTEQILIDLLTQTQTAIQQALNQLNPPPPTHTTWIKGPNTLTPNPHTWADLYTTTGPPPTDTTDTPITPHPNHLQIHLTPDPNLTRAASHLHELHLPLPTPQTHINWQTDIRPNPALLNCRTWKYGGLVAFPDHTPWTQWPGGGHWGPNTASARLTGWHYDRTPGTARLATYITLPQPITDINNGMATVAGGNRAYVSNESHTYEFLLHELAEPHPDTWYTIRHEINCDKGTHTTYVDGKEVLHLTDLPWPKQGFDRGYISCMVGGQSPQDLPPNGATAELDYRNYEVWT